MKGLLEQRWTDHLATVTAGLNSFQHITSLLQEMGTSQAHKAETRLKASGLLGEVQEQFLVHCKDALQGMCCYIIILIVSVSKIFVDGDNL